MINAWGCGDCQVCLCLAILRVESGVRLCFALGPFGLLYGVMLNLSVWYFLWYGVGGHGRTFSCIWRCGFLVLVFCVMLDVLRFF